MYTKLASLFDKKLKNNHRIEEENINDQLSDGLKKVLEIFNK